MTLNEISQKQHIDQVLNIVQDLGKILQQHLQSPSAVINLDNSDCLVGAFSNAGLMLTGISNDNIFSLVVFNHRRGMTNDCPTYGDRVIIQQFFPKIIENFIAMVNRNDTPLLIDQNNNKLEFKGFWWSKELTPYRVKYDFQYGQAVRLYGNRPE